MTFPLFEYPDYYEYLIKISWPALCGLFIIYLFLGVRLFKSIDSTNGNNKPILIKRLRYLSRTILTVAVLAIYSWMFGQAYGDWFERPAITRGIVSSVEIAEDSEPDECILTIKTGEEVVAVRIYKNVSNSIIKNDLIEIAYLPNKKEVFRCTVLTRQADNDIL